MGLFDFFRRKKPTTDAKKTKPEAEHGTRHCFVLCANEIPGDLSRASDVAAKVLGNGYSAEVSEDNLVTVSRGDKIIGFLMHLPAPIPDGEAEAHAEGNFLWPDGKEEAAKHRSHVIVTSILADGGTPVQSALEVSRLALMALELFDGIGVYWGNARVSNSRAAFEAFCERMSDEHFPLPIWLRFQLVRNEHEKVGIYTLGMDQFGLMDIEVDECPLDAQGLFEFVANVAHYLVDSGPVIADGNTVGGSAEQRILVRHLPSMIDESRKVYKIVFDA